MWVSDLITRIQKHQLLAELEEDQLGQILNFCTVTEHHAGAVLLEPNQPNQTVYFLVEGSMEAYLDRAMRGQKFPVKQGECIGEVSLIEGRKTSAFVKCRSACFTLDMPADVFLNKFLAIPKMARRIMAMLSRRMRKNNQAILKSMKQELRLKQVEKELDTARNIQTQTLPLIPFEELRSKGVQLETFFQPAKEVGGDFYDLQILDEDRISFTIADISGKGIPAALYMVRAITTLRMCLAKLQRFEDLLPEMNRLLGLNNKENMFATLLTGLLNVKTGQLRLANGGHLPPIIIRQNQEPVERVMPSGIMLGMFPSGPFQVVDTQLDYGDRIIFYTDGVSEAENNECKMFGTKRFMKWWKENPNCELDRAMQNLKAWVGKAQPSDDITVMSLARH